MQRPLDLHPERALRRDSDLYAIVDIGSNSVRLVVYDELGRAPLPRFNEKSLCRLGSGLDATGELAPEGFRRTVEATRRFRAIADAMGVVRIDVLATEAVRRASNGPALVDAIKEEAQFEVRILSGAEEAHYAALGVISGFYRPTGLVGDMGGGSLEVAEVLDDRVGERMVSLPLGALPVQEMLAEVGTGAKDRIDALLKEKLVPAMVDPVLYAVGGGWRALARVHMMSVEAPIHVAHGYAVDADELRKFAKKLWRLAPAKIAELPGVPARRVPTIAAAALVMDRLLKRLAPERVVFSALGVREGWLFEQLDKKQRYLDPLLEGAQAFGLPQARVPEFGPALARWTTTLFPGETPADKRLRVAACALSDIGWRDHSDFRAVDSFHRVVQFPFIGLDHAERVFLAAAVHARYAGSMDDPRLAPAIGLLSANARRRALILGRTMLLAHRLSGCVPEILEQARLHIDADQLRLEVGAHARGPDSEVVGDRLKLLAQAIGIRRFEVVEGE
ncbi:Ppx/GppA family phosphatase [Geminicoccus roseus]|uniref:Ppx/GppA family phosphatase n=1 Tax=Geminicoccus roseus TaxID=404900 RepID=UPI000422711B|nr:Ppx/GppA family phosphatase [Geminicoccus roseus]